VIVSKTPTAPPAKEEREIEGVEEMSLLMIIF
jgi:hypothetical protein